MSVDERDLKAVIAAVREALEAEGYSRWVSDDKVEKLSTFVLERLEYDRAGRK